MKSGNSRRLTSLAALAMLVTLVSYAAARQAPRARVHITHHRDHGSARATFLRRTITPISRTRVGLRKPRRSSQRARLDNPNLLLLDSGDTIQGTPPLEYYHNRKNNQPTDPMMLTHEFPTLRRDGGGKSRIQFWLAGDRKSAT